VVEGRLSLRSVDSEHEGYVIEPRKSQSGKPNAVVRAEATSKRCNGLAWRFPRGLRAMARVQGSPRNLGDPTFSATKHRKGHR